MSLRRLGHTDIEIQPLILGGNVFGWTADEKTSFSVLDAFVAEGFSAIDTADVYSRWVPGNDSESEKIVGRWLKARGNRGSVHVFTKVGSDMGQGKGLSAKWIEWIEWIEEEVEASLKRLQTDYIDLYQSHVPDPAVAQEETLSAYDRLSRAGKVRFIGASNYDDTLLAEAISVSKNKNLACYQTLQNEYNLYTRDKYEGAVQALVLREGLNLVPYYSLAAGFLTGKYRSDADLGKSPRGQGIAKYLDEKGRRILAALDEVAQITGEIQAGIALAWINAQPGVAAPIASATSVSQLQSLARGARLSLGEADLKRLTDAGKPG